MIAFVALAAFCAGCPRAGTPTDEIRKVVILDVVNKYNDAVRGNRWGRIFCLGVRDQFDAGVWTPMGEKLTADRAPMEDPPERLLGSLRGDFIAYSPVFLPVSKCNNWFNSSPEQRASTVLLLVENVHPTGAHSATPRSSSGS